MANTTNFGWETPDDTDLVKDGALAMRTLGNAIDASLVDLKGGTTGQVLSKNTNTDMDFTWVTQNDADAIQNSIVDAKGDLISATADNTPARLASSGVNGQVLTIDTSTSTGLKWAAPAAGGKVLQVISTQITSRTSVTSNATARTFDDVTGFSASITPTSATSKILVIANISRATSGGAGDRMYLRLMRGSTAICVGDADTGVESSSAFFSTDANSTINEPIIWLDSPATTSATTYKIQFASNATSIVCKFNTSRASDGDGANTASQIILMEIGA